jgi:hypothetical protein
VDDEVSARILYVSGVGIVGVERSGIDAATVANTVDTGDEVSGASPRGSSALPGRGAQRGSPTGRRRSRVTNSAQPYAGAAVGDSDRTLRVRVPLGAAACWALAGIIGTSACDQDSAIAPDSGEVAGRRDAGRPSSEPDAAQVGTPGSIDDAASDDSAFALPVPSDAASPAALADRSLLDEVQRATFGYCWDFAHPASGMARLRSSSGDTVAAGGSGFCVAAIVVATARGWISRSDAVARLLTIVHFLAGADRFHGAWGHLMNGNTGKVTPFSAQDNGGDLVETAFLMEGLFIAREYFDAASTQETNLRDQITTLWDGVEWSFYAPSGKLYWHWSPQYQWESGLTVRGWNEGLIVYILALASPTHPITAATYQMGWLNNSFGVANSSQGYTLYTGPPAGGPLFFSHYSFIGLDPRLMQDKYTFYWQHNVTHTLINRAYCLYSSPASYKYDAGNWGLTACDGPAPNNYWARDPNHDDGTIAPAAALPSMPYTPYASFEALRGFRANAKLWGQYGFIDSFNLSKNWYDTGTNLALDEAPIVDMIENYRSGLLWKLFMAAPEIAPALALAGIQRPTPPTGFYMAVPDAMSKQVDLMRHPDVGRYQLDVATNPGGLFTLTIERADGSVAETVWSGESEPSGTQVVAFGDQLATGPYVAHLTGSGVDTRLGLMLH